jgi:hypothetical protein
VRAEVLVRRLGCYKPVPVWCDGGTSVDAGLSRSLLHMVKKYVLKKCRIDRILR